MTEATAKRKDSLKQTTFAVAEVAAERKPLGTGDASMVDVLRSLQSPKDSHAKNAFDGCELAWGQLNASVRRLEHRCAHALVATVFHAYSYHYKLELSADVFWLAIAQGVAQHLGIHAERYRGQFVSHEGQKELKVSADDLRCAPSSPHMARTDGGQVDGKRGDECQIITSALPPLLWDRVIERFAQAIQGNMKTDFAALMTRPFSTSGPVERTVFACSLMEAAKHYFSYRCCLSCGIPEVTLLGSPDDFAHMMDRVDQLRRLLPDLEWWLTPIHGHLAKLRDTAAGQPDRSWWSQIAHSQGGGSDISMLAGWLADFVPYADDGHGGVRRARRDYKHYCQGKINGIDFGDFSQAVTATEAILDDNGTQHPIKVLAGFLGISQNPTTLALRPAIGCLIARVKLSS